MNGKKKSKHAPSLKFGIEWIAVNDNPSEMDQAVVAESVTVLMLSDLYDMSPKIIAEAILMLRERVNK